jgi:hypothetical protein
MSSRNTAVFGLYRDEDEIGEAIAQLKHRGFRTTDVSMLLPENSGTKDLGYEKHTKAPEGAVAGGVAGAVIGAVVAALVSSGAVTLPTDPFTQSLVSANPVLAVLAGMESFTVLAAIVGGLLGFAWPEYEARRYEGRVRSSNVLLSVHCDNADWRVRAKETLRRTGAQGIASLMEAKADFGTSRRPALRLHPARPLKQRAFLQVIPDARTTRRP